jgi:hypothetical protein
MFSMTKRNTAKGTEIQFDDTALSSAADLTQLVMGEHGVDRPISSREWLMLAVICLQAADRSKEMGDLVAERKYNVLALKCDRAAERYVVARERINARR